MFNFCCIVADNGDNDFLDGDKYFFTTETYIDTTMYPRFTDVLLERLIKWPLRLSDKNCVYTYYHMSLAKKWTFPLIYLLF